MKTLILALSIVILASGVTLAGGSACCKNKSAAECTAAQKAGCCGSHATKTASNESADGCCAKATKADAKAGNCPTCNKAARAAVSAKFGGDTYHFCCKGCLAEFKANPAKYVKSKS